MVRDLQLMKNITPLFERKLVIWGIGQRGRAILDEIISMGAGKNGILLCDSNCEIWGSIVDKQYRILSPKELQDSLIDVDLGDVVILLPVGSLKAQDEILESIEKLFGETVTVYTDYAIEWGIFLNINNPYISREYKEKKLVEREQKIKELEKNHFKDIFMMNQKERVLRYFTFLPLHNDEIILVYQCGKVGSRSVYKSIVDYGRNVLHCHDLADIREGDDDLHKILNLKSGKIVCMVRDPIAREISAMWENIHRSVYYHGMDVSFSELEKACLSTISSNSEFKWFDNQMKKNFNIDVYQYPFDREKGYGIIKEGNIELLLMKMENLNELEDVIGNFLNIGHFRLWSANLGEEKAYRFAFREHKRVLRIPQELLEKTYRDDECIRHFYTEQERNELYEKWLRICN